ncbi:hypothetical protein ACQJBY_031629 [Aegilops geniculata]
MMRENTSLYFCRRPILEMIKHSRMAKKVYARLEADFNTEKTEQFFLPRLHNGLGNARICVMNICMFVVWLQHATITCHLALIFHADASIYEFSRSSFRGFRFRYTANNI